MGLQNILFNTALGKKFFAKHVSSNLMERISYRRIKKQLISIVPRIPAYKNFLARNNIDPKDISRLDISDLPIMDKAGYIQKYSLSEVCLDGTLSDKYCLESSSGYSGEEQFWARNEYEDSTFTKYLEASSKKLLFIDKKSTLIIVCWALGTWVTGEKFAHAARNIAANKKYKLTVITPGNNFRTVMNILKKFQGLYDQIVLAGYPFFIKNLLLKGPEIGIDWSRSKYHIIAGGEGFPEDMRDFFAAQIRSPVNSLTGSLITSAYGSADTGIGVGHETPISILVRRLSKSDQRLARTLFGTSVHNLPMLFQYNPLNYHIESLNNEAVVTAPFNGIPLIRYNLHDNGGVIKFDRIMEILHDHRYHPVRELASLGYDRSYIWHLPMLYIFGRSDGTITFNGANIYLENIKEALALPEIVHTNTGRFTLSRILIENFEPKIKIVVELSQGVQVSDQLKTMYEVGIISTLTKVNKEFKDQLDKLHEKAMPIVEFTKPATTPPTEDIKHRYI